MIYFGFFLWAALVAGVATRNAIIAVINGTIIALLSYAAIPVVAWNFVGIWLLGILSFVFPFICTLGQKSDTSKVLTFFAGFAMLLLFLATVFFSTSAMFHAESYHNVLGPVTDGTFNKDVELLDQSQVQIVDAGLAERRGEELLGSITGLGSRVVIGEFSKQSIRGKLQWIAPLEHAGFWSWKANSTTPGYIRVSVSDIQDAEIVTKGPDGKDFQFRYMKNGWFNDDIQRHIYRSGFSSTATADYTFEIDDDGHPYWTVTTYTRRVGFDGEDATGSLVIDPQTGEIKQYGINDTPAWVDRIQPESFIDDQIKNWGEYVHGWPNWSGDDKVTATPGISLVYSRNSQSKFYIGIQSVKKDLGTMGFMLVDTRTKSAQFYKIIGATEEGAKFAIEGKVQNFHWSATLPILYNVDGTPTYISTLKDGSGNYKGIGVVSVENRAIVTTGDDLQDALRKYRSLAQTLKTNVSVSGHSPIFSIDGTVTRIGSETLGDTTFYYIVVDNQPKKIFIGNLKLNMSMAVTKPGDKVKMQAPESSENRVNITSFVNHDLDE